MKPSRSAAFAALILILRFAPDARADAKAACDAAVQRKESVCGSAEDEVRKGDQAMSEARAAMADRKDLPGLRTAIRKLNEQAAELERDPALSLSKRCTQQGVQPCESTCAIVGTDRCESDGSDKKREDMIRNLKAMEKELGKTESDSSDGQAGGMPEIPKPEKKDGEQKDRSCGGQNPDPACPPKDDPCFKDPRSMACLCPGGVGSDPKCKNAELPPTARNTGGSDDDGGGSGGYGAQSAKRSDGGANEMSNGAARVGGGGSRGGGGGGGGGAKLGGGGGGAAGAVGAAMAAALAGKLADMPGGGFSGGGGSVRGGGTAGSRASKDSPKKYEQLAENSVAMAHRRISGVNGEIGGRAGNLFESVSRAYRSKASTLRK